MATDTQPTVIKKYANRRLYHTGTSTYVTLEDLATMVRQLIRFYGDSLQARVPSYLEFSMNNHSQEQQKLREQMAQAFGPSAFQTMEEQVRKNMGFFTEAMRMFSPFPNGS